MLTAISSQGVQGIEAAGNPLAPAPSPQQCPLCVRTGLCRVQRPLVATSSTAAHLCGGKEILHAQHEFLQNSALPSGAQFPQE